MLSGKSAVLNDALLLAKGEAILVLMQMQELRLFLSKLVLIGA